MIESPSPATPQPNTSTTHVVYAALRFLRVVRHRKAVVFTTLVIAGLLGAIYYATAEREYRGQAAVRVIFTEPEASNESLGQDLHRQQMPTYEHLFASPIVLNDAIAVLEELPDVARADLATIPRDKWLKTLNRRLSARAIRATDFIEISYRSKQPRTAEATLRAVLDSYEDYIDRTNRGPADVIADLLEKHVLDAERAWHKKSQELLAARREFGDLNIENSDIVHPRIRALDQVHAELIKVQQKRIHLQSSQEALEIAIHQGGDLYQHLLALEPAVGREVVLSALGLSTKDGEVVAHLERMLFEESANLDQVTQFFLENHPRVRQLNNVINRLQQDKANYSARQAEMASANYNKKLGGMLMSLVRENLQHTWGHEQALRGAFQKAEQDAYQWSHGRHKIRVFEKQEEQLEARYTTLQSRFANMDIKTEHADVRVSVVGPPFADSRPVSPRILWVLFVCCAGGTCVGVGIIYVLDVLDDRFRSPEELREQLGAPVLAMIRQLLATEEKGVAALQVHAAPDAIESEAFRTLRTTVAFSAEDTECLAISSSEPGDGKTTVLANFGVAAAQAAKRTLLIDADMRRPGLSRMFDVRGQKGLGDLLRGDMDVDVAVAELVIPSGAKNLDLIPAGVRPSDPTGLLDGARFAELLAWARANYDQILVDTPPILAASDATIIGRIVDGLILVVQPEKNHRRLVHRAAEEIHAARLTFVGVVANRVGQTGGTAYYGSGYGYGYGYGYGHGYGNEEQQTMALGDDGSTEHPEDQPPLIQPRRAA